MDKMIKSLEVYHHTNQEDIVQSLEELRRNRVQSLEEAKQGWNMDKKLRSLRGLAHYSRGIEYQSLVEASFQVNRVGIWTRGSGPCMDCHTTK